MSIERLVEEFGDDIFRFCLHMLGNFQDAEDATQEVFEKVLRKHQTLDDSSKAKSWLLSIARNTCIDRMRWWKRTHVFLSKQSAEDRVQPQLSEDALSVLACMQLLSQGQREVVTLRYFQDLSVEETSHVLGISPGTVKSQLARALESLRAKLEAV
ncbi:RNA polymerase sigma factor [bacterium]|nr:RNA polymerase sigma factor [bacterium]